MNVNEKKLEAYLQNKQIPFCQFCGQNHWGVSSKLFQLLEFDSHGLTIGGSSYPVIPITCNNCGNTLMINAIVAGLIDTNEDIAPIKKE